MDTKFLIKLGLTKDESTIYGVLLEGGMMPARTVSLRASIGRQLTYKILDDLIKKDLVEKKETKKITLFAPAHPRKIETLIEIQKKEARNTQALFEDSLGNMISKYNLSIGKPNVQFFEGEDSVKKITKDYPQNDTEIRQWIDISIAMKEIKGEFVEYKEERKNKGITKRIIVPDNTECVSYIKNGSELTDFRIDKNTNTLPTAIQVYDDKVTMLTIEKDKKIGLIIEDQAIANTMKSIFDSLWQNLGKE